MRRLTLGTTGIETSAIGFGCAQLTSHRTKRDAIRTLEHAFELGITHFDVARSYGFGRTESFIREFLRPRRNRITVATKFGLQPPSGPLANNHVIGLAKKLCSPFPKILQFARQRGSAMVRAGAFQPDTAIRSLEKSLRELGTDYVDMFLLHEAEVRDAEDPSLIEVLDKEVQRGTVRCLGIASDCEKLAGKIDQIPASYQVLQFNDNAVNRNSSRCVHSRARAWITYSVFKPLAIISNATTSHPNVVRKFSSRIGADLTNDAIISSLLLAYASQSNSAGVTLFSTTNPAHLATNVSASGGCRYEDGQILIFLEFLDEILRREPVLAGTGTRGLRP
jgi:D-threo-aldose 1-dehydrogenase